MRIMEISCGWRECAVTHNFVLQVLCLPCGNYQRISDLSFKCQLNKWVKSNQKDWVARGFLILLSKCQSSVIGGSILSLANFSHLSVCLSCPEWKLWQAIALKYCRIIVDVWMYCSLSSSQSLFNLRITWWKFRSSQDFAKSEK